MKGAVVDRRGGVTSVQRCPSQVADGPSAVIEALLDLAGSLARESVAPESVAAGSTAPRSVAAGDSVAPRAVGLAVPGLVQDSTGTIVEATNLGMRDVELGALAEHRLGVPVAVTHDVRAAALAEGLLGAARGCRDYLLLTLGTGVGAAVVIDGRPYTGAHGIGGELGHVAVEPRGPLCGCGRAGCLEALGSAGAVARRYAAMSRQSAPGEAASSAPADAEWVASRAAAGDPVATQIWREAVDALALAIANYATLLDPQIVVIGGGMSSAGSSLFDPLVERVRALVRFGGEPCPIVPAALGEDAGRRGAAIAAWRAAGIDEAELEAWAA